MHFQNLLVLGLGLCFSSCAVHGVVVNKSFKPMPIAAGDGAEGFYRIELRDSAKVVHRQLVSREVFAAYQIGDDFDAEVPLREMYQRNLAKRERTKAAVQWAQLRQNRPTRVHREIASETVAHISLRPEMLPETEAF